MVLTTTESNLCACVTLMLLNGEIWKESLQLFSILKMFIQINAHPDSVVISKDYSYLFDGGR